MDILDTELKHYGTPRHSGRYPWGSGEKPFQRTGDFLSRVEKLHKQGFTEAQIAAAFNISTTKLRAEKAIASAERRRLNVAKAHSLKADGFNTSEIARELGVNESTVRSWFDSSSEARMNQAMTTAGTIREKVAEKGIIDIGKGVERSLGISREKLDQALLILEAEGYEIYTGSVEQATNPGKETIIKVICPPGTPHRDIYQFDKINTLDDITSHDNGESFTKLQYPASMDSNRVKICYAEEGGSEKDGLIEIRRGVDDLSLGNSHYAQVRILVDDVKFMKGMAVYSDNLPPGVDIIYNTNKKLGTDKMNVFKDIETTDPNNPFGSLIKANGQSEYIDKNGNKKLSLINKRADEGDWDDWADALPSQFLSKQDKSLIKNQLKLTLDDKQSQFDEIMSLTNPVVKKEMLRDFSNNCDSTAVYLKAMALPRQKYQVMLPVPTMKDNEVYAPNYKDGEKVALIRYPHGGTFEIPIVTVNNKQADAIKMIGKNPADAVCVNSKVAARLSGADFDGDTVMVIPTGGKYKITSTPPLKDLEGYDPKDSYGAHETKVNSRGETEYYRNGMKYKVISKSNQTEVEMGKITNLITDMTLKGADEKELAQAVRHSMTVIDAKKHKLDYRQSEIDNNISALKKKYQPHTDDDGFGGASTLISLAKSEVRVDKKKGSPRIDPVTGKLIQKTDDSTYVDKKGVEQKRKQTSTRMTETDDANTLSSGTTQEKLYAAYANTLKRMANTARLAILATPPMKYNPSAKKTYAKEVSILLARLNLAEKNAPLERKAQYITQAKMQALISSNPDLKSDKAMQKKLKNQILMEARNQVGAKRTTIELNDRLWEAIQAGALSDSRLKSIFRHVETETLWSHALPHSSTALSQAKINRIDRLLDSGYSTKEIADAVGVSSSTVIKYIKGEIES